VYKSIVSVICHKFCYDFHVDGGTYWWIKFSSILNRITRNFSKKKKITRNYLVLDFLKLEHFGRREFGGFNLLIKPNSPKFITTTNFFIPVI
jgi:hypothetical protein